MNPVTAPLPFVPPAPAVAPAVVAPAAVPRAVPRPGVASSKAPRPVAVAVVAPPPPVAPVTVAPPVPVPAAAPIAAPAPALELVAQPTLPDADLEMLEEEPVVSSAPLAEAELVTDLPRPIWGSLVGAAPVPAQVTAPIAFAATVLAEPVRTPAPSLSTDIAIDDVEVEALAIEAPAVREPYHTPTPSILMRLTMHSMLLGTPDPILVQKATPEVAARRRRLTWMVKGAIAACAAVCAIAVGASAVSANEGTKRASAAPPQVAAVVHGVVVAKEERALEGNKLRPRASQGVAASTTTSKKGARAKK
jgi:hypothetical protein